MEPRAGKSNRMTDFVGNMKSTRAFLLDALDAGGSAQLQRHVRRAQDVAGHVAQRAAAEIVEAAPVERLIEIAAELRSDSPRRPDVYGRWFGDAQPQVPIERLGNRLRAAEFRSGPAARSGGRSRRALR